MISCTEDTGSLGVFPEQDAVSTSSTSFDVLSNDLLNAVVPASSTSCYLGRVIDPETDEAITATFATQFHSFENYTFPEKANIIPDENGYPRRRAYGALSLDHQCRYHPRDARHGGKHGTGAYRPLAHCRPDSRPSWNECRG